MSGRTDWSYVQARLQARHGERLDEGDWRMLEGAKSLSHFLDRARTTSLHRFTERLDAQMSSQAIERALRAEWRRYVAELAAWVTPIWKPAVLWVTYVPDLPALDPLLKGAAPDWVRQDPVLAPLAEDDPHKRVVNLDNSPLAPLSPGNAGAPAGRWLTYWRALWPQHSAEDRHGMDEFCGVVAKNLGRLAQAGGQETSLRYRQDLARAVTRMFRRRAGTPVALFAHLTLVAIDLERLRGGLVRRRLFEAAAERRAA